VKILLDECLPLDLRHSLVGHEAHTVQWAGLKGKTNGELLEAAEASGYHPLLTVDKGIPHQHRPGGRKLSIIVLEAATNQLEDLELLIGPVLEACLSILPGDVVFVPRH